MSIEARKETADNKTVMECDAWSLNQNVFGQSWKAELKKKFYARRNSVQKKIKNVLEEFHLELFKIKKLCFIPQG